MVDQSKVTSGFDVEFLMGEEFIRYFLLTSLETGSIKRWNRSSGVSASGVPYHTVTINHPPNDLAPQRLYHVNPEFVGREHPYQDLVAAEDSRQRDEFQVTILAGAAADISVKTYPSVIDLGRFPPVLLAANRLDINLQLRFELVFDTDPNGLIKNIGLQLTLVDVDGPLVDSASGSGMSKAELLLSLKEDMDRRVPFALAGGGSLQRIVTRKFTGGEGPNAIGVYINLALREGPEPNALVPERGDAGLAQNFLEAGTHMAFAMPESTYGLLARDFKFKLAVPKPDSPGDFHYPLMDGGSQVGVVKGISVYPELASPGVSSNPPPQVFSNVLVIDLNGEWAIDHFFDADFHFRIRLVPTEGHNGLLDFEVDFDLSFSALAQIVTLFLSVALVFVLPKLGLSLIALSVLTFKIIERIGESIARPALEAELERTSFLDTLPHKLTVEQRRWDPLYNTLHRVEAAEANLSVNLEGFAFDCRKLFIGRKTVPLQDTVIRTETRGPDQAMTGLIYRANGIGDALTTDLVAVFPATDRMPYVALLPRVGNIESERVELTLEQLEARLAAGDRLLQEIDYKPYKIAVREHQIDQILALSNREADEIVNLTGSLLRSEIRTQRGAVLRESAIEELTASLGRAPDEGEIRSRVNQLVESEAVAAFPARLAIELDQRTSFDLEPFEFADLQQRKLLVLGRNHLEIRSMTRNGRTTVFYRDFEWPFQPQADKRDNLLALPHYTRT